MARPLRIQFPGALYHVTSRGNDRAPIVRHDFDRSKRLDWLRRTVETYAWRLHAFVLMDNHEHLFVETPEANLSAGMHCLNGSYTGYFNHRHGHVGHLFQGRFKGYLVEEEGHFLEVSRYIHLNPVRARLVQRPEQYLWSSYPGYVRLGRRVPWVTYGRVLTDYGGDGAAARQAYGRFVAAGIEERIKSPFAEAVGGLILGSERFVDRIRQLLGDLPKDPEVPERQRIRARPPLEAIVAAVGAYFGCDVQEWIAGQRTDDLSRAVGAYLARRRFGYPAGQVARALGYTNHSSVSRAIRRVEAAGRSALKAAADVEQQLANH